MSQTEALLTIGTIEGECRVALRETVRLSHSVEGPLIEIGSLFGHSAAVIAEEKLNSQRLICVDAFKWNPYGLSKRRHRELLDLNLQHFYRTANTELIAVEDNQEFFRSFRDLSPALVFIDAGHFYEDVKNDILWALEVGTQVICGDDYHYEGVSRAVDELLGVEVKVVEGKFWVADRRTF